MRTLQSYQVITTDGLLHEYHDVDLIPTAGCGILIRDRHRAVLATYSVKEWESWRVIAPTADAAGRTITETMHNLAAHRAAQR